MITFIMVELEVAKISPLRCNFRNYALLLSVIVTRVLWIERDLREYDQRRALSAFVQGESRSVGGNERVDC